MSVLRMTGMFGILWLLHHFGFTCGFSDPSMAGIAPVIFTSICSTALSMFSFTWTKPNTMLDPNNLSLPEEIARGSPICSRFTVALLYSSQVSGDPDFSTSHLDLPMAMETTPVQRKQDQQSYKLMSYAPAKPRILKGHSESVITTPLEVLISLFWFFYLKLLRFIKMTRGCAGDPVLS